MAESPSRPENQFNQEDHLHTSQSSPDIHKIACPTFDTDDNSVDTRQAPHTLDHGRLANNGLSLETQPRFLNPRSNRAGPRARFGDNNRSPRTPNDRGSPRVPATLSYAILARRRFRIMKIEKAAEEIFITAIRPSQAAQTFRSPGCGINLKRPHFRRNAGDGGPQIISANANLAGTVRTTPLSAAYFSLRRPSFQDKSEDGRISWSSGRMCRAAITKTSSIDSRTCLSPFTLFTPSHGKQTFLISLTFPTFILLSFPFTSESSNQRFETDPVIARVGF
jgi:hypothetical protein